MQKDEPMSLVAGKEEKVPDEPSQYTIKGQAYCKADV